jgi:hypothetical protein
MRFCTQNCRSHIKQVVLLWAVLPPCGTGASILQDWPSSGSEKEALAQLPAFIIVEWAIWMHNTPAHNLS